MRSLQKPTVLLGVLVSLALYFGLYRLWLAGKVYHLAGVSPVTGQNLFAIQPDYRSDNATLEAVFRPAHGFDRFLRPDYWNTIEKMNGAKWKNPVPSATDSP